MHAEPLVAKLSHLYTAVTIAADNALELRIPHRTTGHGGPPAAPWLVSTTLWFRFLRHIPANGTIPLRDLKQQAALPANEFRMWLTRFESWWGYLRLDPATKLVQPTAGGRTALLAIPYVLAQTEATWASHFPTLLQPLTALVAALEQDHPQLPALSTLNYGLFSSQAQTAQPAPCTNSFPVLLAKALNAFALDYEQETFLALALSANILRVIPPQGIALRDLPNLSGIAREACLNATKLLLKSGAIKPLIASEFTGKAIRRTDRGEALNTLYREALRTIEARWRTRHTATLIHQLTAVLPSHGDLLAKIQPHPLNWRASRPAPKHLPCFPMILHRGGFPDGS